MSNAPKVKPRNEPPLSQRVATLKQIIPLLIIATVMFYEMTSHLIFETKTHPFVTAFEMLVFGVGGSAVTWITLSWVSREIANRERAEGKADALNAMMQEMHHRIKNNLQTVADLLTLEMSRNRHPQVQESLRDSITRIKSIAASHQMLSLESVGATDVTELARLVGDQARRSMLRPDEHISLTVEGPGIFLNSKQATAFSLVLNELVCNAMEHGFSDRQDGHIAIELDWDGDEILLRVCDDGHGLPEGFDLATSRGLGLQIARTLVEKDLRGRMGIANDDSGNRCTTAWVRIQRGSSQ
jgi:two-component system, sensor histidine kinase PdtaS